LTQILGTVGSVLAAIRFIGASDIGTRPIRKAYFISRAVVVSVGRVAGNAGSLNVVAGVGAVAHGDLAEVHTVGVRGAAQGGTGIVGADFVTRTLRIVPLAFTAVPNSVSVEDTLILGSIGTVSVSGASCFAGISSGRADFVGSALGRVAAFDTVTIKEIAILISDGVAVGNFSGAIRIGGTKDQ
jgi:hypothetical protein